MGGEEARRTTLGWEGVWPRGGGGDVAGLFWGISCGAGEGQESLYLKVSQLGSGGDAAGLRCILWRW